MNRTRRVPGRAVLVLAALAASCSGPSPAGSQDELANPNQGRVGIQPSQGSVAAVGVSAAGGSGSRNSSAGAADVGAGASVTCTVPEEMAITNRSSNRVTVFPITATGSASPLRAVSGAATGLAAPYGIAVDTVNGEVFVADHAGPSITVHRRSDSGDVAPLRTIRGPTTGLGAPYGIDVDTVNDELVVSDLTPPYVSILVFDRAASGDVAPKRRISGPSTGLGPAQGYAVPVAVDAVNGEIAAAVAGGNFVVVFARTANGDVPALRTIAGPSTGISAPQGLAVDTVHGEIVVANSGVFTCSPCILQNDSIEVFGRTATGDAAPLRRIAGPTSEMLGPMAVTVDLVSDAIFAINQGNNSVTAYRRTASGDVAPLVHLSAAAGLDGPMDIAIDPGGDQYACPSGFACSAAGGCVPPGGDDCGNGTYCPTGTTCYLDYCRGTGGSGSTWPHDGGGNVCSAQCAGGGCCPPGYSCASTPGCIPDGAVDCGDGFYCGAGTRCVQVNGQTMCESGTCGTICGDNTCCPAGYDCAAQGCMPAGSVDCGDGHYCSAGTLCDVANGSAVCDEGSCATQCTNGTCCPSGYDCGSGGCLPHGDVDCGNGYYCLAGTTCRSSGGSTLCYGGSDCGTTCSDGTCCPPGTTCATVGCVPDGQTDCHDGHWCQSGKNCGHENGETTCFTPSGGGGATCTGSDVAQRCPNGVTVCCLNGWVCCYSGFDGSLGCSPPSFCQ